MANTRIRRLAIAITALALVATALAQVSAPWREPVRAFEDSAGGALAEAIALRSRAASFDQQRTLAALREGAPSFVYSLSEAIDQAKRERLRGSRRRRPQTADLLSLDFKKGRDPGLVQVGREAPWVIASGRLVLKGWYWSSSLATAKPLSIQPQDLGELEVRARASVPAKLQVAWDTARGPFKVWKTAIELIPDGALHTYRTDLSRLSPVQGGSTDQRITRLVLRPNAKAPGVKRGDFELDYVRLHHRKASFAKLADRQLLRSGDEQRQGIYVNSPLSLHYDLALPQAPLAFSAGLAAFQDGDPVTFRLEILARGDRKTLIEARVEDSSGWREVRADLSPYAGQRVELVLTATSRRGNVALWGSPEIYEPRADPTRIIVFLEDTERGDHISALGYGRPTTPFKDEFFGRGTLFARAFSQAPSTRPSCVSFMTSLPTRANGVSSAQQFLADSFLTLPEVLKSRGFSTAVFTQNVNSGPSSGLQQGVDIVRDNSFLGASSEGVYSEETLAWVDRHLDRDFFLYLHTLDPHGAYTPPPSHRGWFEAIRGGTPVEPGKLDPPWLEGPPTAEGRIALYDGEIAYNDEMMRGFMDALGERIPLEDTLLVFLSDHGEHQGEEGLWGHHPPSLKGGIRVPLMFRYDRALPGRGVVEEPAQLMDLAPTLLELAGVDPQGLPFAGHSLVPVLQGRADAGWSDRLIMSEENPLTASEDPQLWSSLFFRGYHLLYSNSLPGAAPDDPPRTTVRLYDDTTDPSETHPMEGALARWLFAWRVEPLLLALAEQNDAVRGIFHGGGDNAIQMDDNTLHQLRTLGYVE